MLLWERVFFYHHIAFKSNLAKEDKFQLLNKILKHCSKFLQCNYISVAIFQFNHKIVGKKEKREMTIFASFLSREESLEMIRIWSQSFSVIEAGKFPDGSALFENTCKLFFLVSENLRLFFD